MPEVRIKLGPNGEVKGEAFGFKGEGCKEKTAFLEDLFGKPLTEELKSSYYEEEQTECDKYQDGLPSGHCG